MKVALIQMDIALGNPEQNRQRAAELVREAATGANLVMLPEMWSTGYALEQLAGNLADRDGGPSGALLAQLAQEQGIFLAGSVAHERDGAVQNLATVYGPDGRCLAEYAKIHLVPMMDEHLYLQPGDRITTVKLGDEITAGLAICYDLRFPELFRSMALEGAQLMLLPAEWPAPRLPHWRTLVMARAIENQCYVLACNRVGSDRANRFPGHSMVVDPWGNILAEGGEGEEIIRAEIDPAKVAQIRAAIPVFRDRRPSLYRLGE